MRRGLGWIAGSLLALLAVVGLYVGVAAALMLWPVNARAPAEPPRIEAERRQRQ